MSENNHKPSFRGALMELRAPLEALTLIPTLPFLKYSPKGEFQPVLVLPGFLATDNSTHVLRRYLNKQNFRAFPWELGRAPGLQDVIYKKLEKRVIALHEEFGQKVSIVGWSLGGLYARTLAHKIPDHVRQVVTVASPFGASQMKTSEKVQVSGPILRLYERLNPDLDTDKLLQGVPVWEMPPPVPSTSIYSESDGIASWHYCIDPVGVQTENLRVSGSHTGMTHNPVVLYAIAERLSQLENDWQPFESKTIHRVLFPKPCCASDLIARAVH